MLYHITWASYGYALSFTLLLYYTLLIAYYFKKDIAVWFRRRLSFTAPGNFSQQEITTEANNLTVQPELFAPEEKENLPPKNGQDLTMALIGAAIDEIKASIIQMGHDHYVQEEILYCLQRILQKYPALKGSPFQASITHLIVMELQNHCSIALSAEEVSAVWNA